MQDFCTHSNLVELPRKTQELIEESFFASSPLAHKLFFQELILTGYDPETDSEFPAGDRYPHLRHSKDTLESPLYIRARRAATSFCSRELSLIRIEVRDRDWLLLRHYQG
jgi:hypothetical protein